MNQIIIDEIIKSGLKEDISYMDLATDLLIPADQRSQASLWAKETGIIAGIPVFQRVFQMLDSGFEFKVFVKEGDKVTKGQKILELCGATSPLLKGERLALNLLQRMSGIATTANAYARQVRQYPVKVVDTRKTTPNLRILEKYAVRMGGCYNHRFNLSDTMMIKDNHIQAVGSVSEALRLGRQHIPHTSKIEIEVKNLREFTEALKAGADIIMLDNMSLAEIEEAVRINADSRILEVSGGIHLENIEAYARTGIHIISVGALTHSSKSLDISLVID
ncbi:MAG: nicotinate-nucleotide pyrophosphorylase [delta proteobacterium ML8_F1]|nr:MAG: nicotinate-nucleotide pyrophosphorylase [delta proteobacterium ML8_F1]